MNTLFTILFIISCPTLALAHGSSRADKVEINESQTKFGDKMTQKKLTTLGNVISNYSDFKGRKVAFEATPKKVCKKKGCWMVLEDGQYEVRTLFKDYGFFVPPSILGKKVRVEGAMGQKKVSAATIRHYMKDEGLKAEEIKKIKSGEMRFQFTADAVEII